MSAKLAKKLAEVMAAVNRIPKRGHNSFHNYDFATEADIAEAIRGELASRNVAILPAITGNSREPVGEKGSVLTTLNMEFTFIDGDSGEMITRPWLGAGTDKEDKGAYKAITGGEKYFLLKTFLLPTGDDPEQDSKDDKREAKQRDKATIKVTAAQKKARPKVPDGVVFIDLYVPKNKGNAEWAEVTFSSGETGILHKPQYLSIAMQYAQDNTPLAVTTRINGKGNTDIEKFEKWAPEDTDLTEPLVEEPELAASDIGF